MFFLKKITREALVQDVLRKQFNIDRDVRVLQTLMVKNSFVFKHPKIIKPKQSHTREAI